LQLEIVELKLLANRQFSGILCRILYK